MIFSLVSVGGASSSAHGCLFLQVLASIPGIGDQDVGMVCA
jgi:hypothetical protein